jgi:hypothetical protein
MAKSTLLAFSTGGLDGMPIDMRIMAFISIGVTMIFSCLFLFSGASSIIRSKVTRINYSPTMLNVAMLAVLIFLSVLALSEYSATSKISMAESRGLPFPFLALTEVRGICHTGMAFWQCRLFENLNPLLLIIDVLIVYVAICVSIQTVSEPRIFDPKHRSLNPSDPIRESGR